jgi:hypothetical protein
MLSYFSSWIFTDKHILFKNRLEKRLHDTGINTDSFFKELEDSNSIIAGSFPLQVYLQENWDGSDVDIFTTNDNMQKYLSKHFAEKVIHENDTCSYRGYVTDRARVTEYITHRNLKLQVIKFMDPIESDDLTKYTFSKFDIDICKVSFDGKEYHIGDRNAVKTRNATVGTTWRCLSFKTYERIKKYEQRGFTFVNKSTFVDKYISKMN